MKSIVFLVSVLFLNAAQAVSAKACEATQKKIESGREHELQINQETYKMSAAALRHYHSTIKPEFRTSIVQFVAYMNRGSVMGYRVDISDETDEGTVSYYFDGSTKLVSGFWHNQSPESFWFCK